MNNHEQRLDKLENAVVWLGLTCIGLAGLGLAALYIICAAITKHQDTLNAIIAK